MLTSSTKQENELAKKAQEQLEMVNNSDLISHCLASLATKKLLLRFLL